MPPAEKIPENNPGQEKARPKQGWHSTKLVPAEGAPQAPEPEYYPATFFSPSSVDQLSTGPIPTIDQWPTQPLPKLRKTQRGDQSESVPGDDLAQAELFDEIATLILPSIDAKLTTGATGSQRAIEEPAGGYLSLARNLVKSSGIYALAALASPLVSLILAPFLTHHLSQTDYGVLTILSTAIGLGAGITQLGMGSAFFRAYSFDYSSATDRRAVLSTVITLLALSSIPLALLATVIAPALAGLLLRDASLGGLVTLAALAILAQNLTVPGFAWLRAENRPLFFSLLSISNLVIALGANVVLVGVLRWGVAGSLIATGSGYAGVVVFTLPVLLVRAGIRVRGDVLWNLLTFGGPQVLSFVSYWVLQLSDRYLLSIFVSLAQTASYGVAYSLGAVLATIVISPFSLAWPATMFAVAKRKEAPQVFQLVFRWFSLLLLFVAFAISIADTFLLRWFFPASYYSAAPVIPLVAESIVFYGAYIIFMCGASIQRKTWLAAAFTTMAALINVLLNLVLIPLYGSIGAAASTLIAYIALATAAYLANRIIYPVPFEIGRFVLALLIGVALFLGANWLSGFIGVHWRWPLTILGLVLYAGCLFILGNGHRAIRGKLAIFSKRRKSWA